MSFKTSLLNYINMVGKISNQNQTQNTHKIWQRDNAQKQINFILAELDQQKTRTCLRNI